MWLCRMNPYKSWWRESANGPQSDERRYMQRGCGRCNLRALAMRHMELPVGDFITDALKKNVPDKQVWTIVKRQGRREPWPGSGLHCRLLRNKWWKVKRSPRLQQAWIEHPDHTIVKAMVAERAIFFVLLPLFRACGDAGMRTVSADISRDEQVHVATNSLVTKELGLDISPSLDKLRKATMQLGNAAIGSKWVQIFGQKFWLDSSDRLMYEGKAPELSFHQIGADARILRAF